MARVDRHTQEMVRYSHWVLTMPEVEAALISKGCAAFINDKEKCAAFMVAWWKNKR